MRTVLRSLVARTPQYTAIVYGEGPTPSALRLRPALRSAAVEEPLLAARGEAIRVDALADLAAPQANRSLGARLSEAATQPVPGPGFGPGSGLGSGLGQRGSVKPQCSPHPSTEVKGGGSAVR